ncbi:hypothetical protein GCM10010191_45090 [Actinomadura vinacea]|uniref:4Fe4S-binding SPASM domain-containing protein n=1 Tax=Actinomadura vinacea TaxID=115336 RepID=A0ABP5WHV1_9ACTN
MSWTRPPPAASSASSSSAASRPFTPHARTHANIQRAVSRGIPIRIGIIDTGNAQRVQETRRELEVIGVDRIDVDHVRPFGRGADGQAPDKAGLCGRCGNGKAAIGPSGSVSPCIMSSWMSVGNVHEQALADILAGTAMAEANASIRTVARSQACDPDGECSPGHPGSECNPRT